MITINEQIVKLLIKMRLKNRADLLSAKKSLIRQFKVSPVSHADLLTAYRLLLRKKQIKQNRLLEKLLIKRPIRSLSGVAIIAVLTKPYFCPGKCAYCPKEKNIPKSYLSNEPAVMRAVLCHFHPYQQVAMRLRALRNTGHHTDKIELIIMGGTWNYLPRQYQTWFIKQCFASANGIKQQQANKQNLAKLQKINERAKHRIIGLTLETRPDYLNPSEIKRMRQLGATRVEIGVQTTDNSILQKNRRGHDTATTIQAIRWLKQTGFKICYHLMPNLPGSTPTKDLSVFKKIFTNPDFCPDMIKIYPCVVVKGSLLYRWWKQKKYHPYSEQQLINLLIRIKKIVPPYVRINRLIRDIPSTSIEAGNKISNLRQVVQQEMKQRGLSCHCIRCREIKTEKINPHNLKLITRVYPASRGKEYFLSYEDVKRDKLAAFLRLRINQQVDPLIIKNFPELKNAALIRELHTYGQIVPIGQKNKQATQHLGLGKKLMIKAELIVRQLGIKKIAVISGVGVREYYHHLGYHQQGNYQIKNI